jgi:cyclophilin family peptidyl-prolyl cis-trans isomerase
MAPNKNPQIYHQKHKPQPQPIKVHKKKSRKKLFLVLGILAIFLVLTASYFVANGLNQPAADSVTPTATPTATPTPTATATAPLSEYNSSSTKVLFHTSAGDITLELRSDKPITTANFIKLVNQGKYAGTTFHRVIAGFMIQGGQVTNAASISDEIGTDNHNMKYTIAMAKTNQPNSATSEFFINVADNNQQSFDQTYTVFGRVISGQDIVDKIAQGAVVDNPVTGEKNSLPVSPVTLLKATVIS